MGVLGCKAHFGLVDRREGYKRAGSAWLGALEGHQTAIGRGFVDSVGYSDRTLLKDSLCIALAKSEEEVERFDECFDIFFTRDEFRDREEEDESEGLSSGVVRTPRAGETDVCFCNSGIFVDPLDQRKKHFGIIVMLILNLWI